MNVYGRILNLVIIDYEFNLKIEFFYIDENVRG